MVATQRHAPGGTAATSSDASNLDVLRAIAVLAVLVDHTLETVGHRHGARYATGDWTSDLGRLGVLLFFVHTCYVLMHSMRRTGLRGRALVRSFFVRRAFRVYPLAMLCVILVVLAHVPKRPWTTFEAPGTAALLSNLALTFPLTGHRSVLLPLWSLPYEVQMYLVLPLLYVALGARRRLGVAALAWALSIAGFFACDALPEAFLSAHPWLAAVIDRLGLLAFAPCFLAGVLGYALDGRIARRAPGAAWIAWLVVIGAGYVGVGLWRGDAVPQWVQWLACLLVGVGIPFFENTRSTSLNRAAALIAKYSYGIYLSHFVALWLAFYVLPSGPPAVQVAMALLVTLAMSIGAFHAVERPAIRLGMRLGIAP